jgi:acetone carboxylase gamma subunit
MPSREAFEVVCPRCGHNAGKVVVTMDADGNGVNKSERRITKRCECGESFIRREA